MEKERSKESILLGKANGAYMNCTLGDVLALHEELTFRVRKIRTEHKDIIYSCSSDLMPIVVSEFENPYDELYNLLLQAHNNTCAGWHLFFNVYELEKKLAEVTQLLRREQVAKGVFTDFILSHGLAAQFKAYCEGQTESNEDKPTGSILLLENQSQPDTL